MKQTLIREDMSSLRSDTLYWFKANHVFSLYSYMHQA